MSFAGMYGTTGVSVSMVHFSWIPVSLASSGARESAEMKTEPQPNHPDQAVKDRALLRGAEHMDVRPFVVHVPQDTLDDLRTRLGRTRWTGEIEDGWAFGVNRDELRALVAHWTDRFD